MLRCSAAATKWRRCAGPALSAEVRALLCRTENEVPGLYVFMDRGLSARARPLMVPKVLRVFTEHMKAYGKEC